MTNCSDTAAHVARLGAAWNAALSSINLTTATTGVLAHAPAPCAILAVGKCAGPMLDGARVLAPDVETLCVLPDGAPAPTTPSTVLRVAHPRPDARVLDAARKAMALAARGTAQRPLWLCLSGGTSACLGAPLQPGQLDLLGDVINRMMKAGADIEALNTVRKHACQVLGGRLGAAARGLVAAVTVDIAQQDVALVGSGPACPDATTLLDARAVLERFSIHTPLALAPSPTCPRWPHHVVASPVTLQVALRNALGPDGVMATPLLMTPDAFETHVIDVALERAGTVACVGEIVFPVPPEAPPGGRAAHLAVFAALRLMRQRRTFVILCAGSDGRDGPTDAAGACVTSETFAGVDPAVLERALAAGETHALLLAHGALLPRQDSPLNLLDGCVLWTSPGAHRQVWA